MEVQRPVDRRDETGWQPSLRHERRGANLARGPGELPIVVSRAEDDPGRIRQVPDNLRRLEPVEHGHRDVEDDHVGVKLAAGFDSRPSFGGRRDHVELEFEQSDDPRARLGVIVRYDDA